MRTWRQNHWLEGEALFRANARSYANVYKNRGHLIRQPCADCGSQDVEMHHEDYAKPLEVVWLCRPCHLRRHRIG